MKKCFFYKLNFKQNVTSYKTPGVGKICCNAQRHKKKFANWALYNMVMKQNMFMSMAKNECVLTFVV